MSDKNYPDVDKALAVFGGSTLKYRSFGSPVLRPAARTTPVPPSPLPDEPGYDPLIDRTPTGTLASDDVLAIHDAAQLAVEQETAPPERPPEPHSTRTDRRIVPPAVAPRPPEQEPLAVRAAQSPAVRQAVAFAADDTIGKRYPLLGAALPDAAELRVGAANTPTTQHTLSPPMRAAPAPLEMPAPEPRAALAWQPPAPQPVLPATAHAPVPVQFETMSTPSAVVSADAAIVAFEAGTNRSMLPVAVQGFGPMPAMSPVPAPAPAAAPAPARAAAAATTFGEMRPSTASSAVPLTSLAAHLSRNASPTELERAAAGASLAPPTPGESGARGDRRSVAEMFRILSGRSERVGHTVAFGPTRAGDQGLFRRIEE